MCWLLLIAIAFMISCPVHSLSFSLELSLALVLEAQGLLWQQPLPALHALQSLYSEQA